jgi:hypothetical protein
VATSVIATDPSLHDNVSYAKNNFGSSGRPF